MSGISQRFLTNWQWCHVHHAVRGRRGGACVGWFWPERGEPQRCRFVTCQVVCDDAAWDDMLASEGRLL